uniref:Mediator of RNA polymerase II transcription subunit 11 n=1 Tax=Daphnia atkinsoni TaxID=342845 RepID=A0A4Y7LWY5_9CRUS|nr:EOG090X0LXA [Daphnia atkinsoni]
MASTSMPIERLQALDNVEKEIASCIQSAGQALTELSKDKASMKQVESHTSQFLKTLNHVEGELSKHINYLTQVSTGQPHEGSAYGSVKMYKTARHRMEHTRTRLQDLENLKNRALASTVRPTVFCCFPSLHMAFMIPVVRNDWDVWMRSQKPHLLDKKSRHGQETFPSEKVGSQNSLQKFHTRLVDRLRRSLRLSSSSASDGGDPGDGEKGSRSSS